MTALSADRVGLVDSSAAPGARTDVGVRSTTATFYYNQLLMVGADDGLIKPVTSSAGALSAHACGVSLERTSQIYQNPATVQFRCGIFNFKNSSGSPLAETDRGNIVYAEDDQTVRKDNNSGHSCVAGRMDRLAANGDVFVLVDGAQFTSGSQA